MGSFFIYAAHFVHFVHQRGVPIMQQTRNVDPNLRRRFYEGVNFKRGMIAYLYFNGERTTREGVRRIAPILGNRYTCVSHNQYAHWNQLQVLLKKIGMLIPITGCSIYDWNDALVPLLYKQALEKKRAGISVEEILAICFPDNANSIDSFF